MSHTHELSPAEMMARFEEICRDRGLRVTHQRMEIFKELTKAKEHPTAEYVFNKVRRRLSMISLDTVYRTLSTFEEHGLIKRVHLVDNTARFDINLDKHHHLVCTRCNKIEDFYWEDFDSLKLPPALQAWGDVDSRHVEVRGLCSGCRGE